MGNMSYCRFENTAHDLRDCVDAWDDDLSSKSEIRGKAAILKMAADIFDAEGIDFDEEEWEQAVERLKDKAKATT